jgi:hypothetical protein
MSAIKAAAVGSLLFGLQIAAAFAAGPPKLDVTMTCDGAARLTGRDKQGCLQDERAAQGVLVQNWSKYGADERTRCVALVQAGGAASYVELLSCLESGRYAKGSREGDSILIETDQSEPLTVDPPR